MLPSSISHFEKSLSDKEKSISDGHNVSTSIYTPTKGLMEIKGDTLSKRVCS